VGGEPVEGAVDALGGDAQNRAVSADEPREGEEVDLSTPQGSWTVRGGEMAAPDVDPSGDATG